MRTNLQRQIHNEYMRSFRKERVDANCCVCCGTSPIICSSRCQACYDEYRITSVGKRNKDRDAAFQAYGGDKCACCGLHKFSFLCKLTI